MMIRGMVAGEMEVREVDTKAGQRSVRSIRVLDDSTGDVIEATAWREDSRLATAKKGQPIELTAKSWNAYAGRLRIEVTDEPAKQTASAPRAA